MTPEKTKIIIVGASSAIAQALAEKYAGATNELILVGRNINRTQEIANHLNTQHGGQVAYAAVGDPAYIWDCERKNCKLLIIATGMMPEETTNTTPEETKKIFEANTLIPIEWCQLATHPITGMKFGTICIIGSVAGDRGRASNYIYGATKAAIEIYCQGIAHRIAKQNVKKPWSGPHICLIKPGMTRSPMTADLPNSPLIVSPQTTAAAIIRAIQQKKTVAYCPGFWKWIMLVIKTIPNAIFKKTNL